MTCDYKVMRIIFNVACQTINIQICAILSVDFIRSLKLTSTLLSLLRACFLTSCVFGRVTDILPWCDMYFIIYLLHFFPTTLLFSLNPEAWKGMRPWCRDLRDQGYVEGRTSLMTTLKLASRKSFGVPSQEEDGLGGQPLHMGKYIINRNHQKVNLTPC